LKSLNKQINGILGFLYMSPTTNVCSNKVLRIVGICGSLRSHSSYTKKALSLALKGCVEAVSPKPLQNEKISVTIQVETTLIDLNDYNLQFCDGLDSQR
jgi:multimeric flavodoxin WrbA